jgi:invasion protein IalB
MRARSTTCHKGLIAGLMLIAAGNSHPGWAQEAKSDASLLGGATSISETHGDWVVNCQVVTGQKLCLMSQQQFSRENANQRLLAMELQAAGPDSVAGTLALPFGLRFPNGVELAVDGVAFGQKLAFETCYVVGCLVKLQFDAADLEKLQKGTNLGISANAAETAQPITFGISLKGFSRALQRSRSLMQP